MSGHDKEVVEQATSSEGEIKTALEKGDTRKVIDLLLQLKEEQVHSQSKDAKKKIEYFIGKTVAQVAEGKAGYQSPTKKSPEEDQIVRILVNFLEQKGFSFILKEVEQFVHQALGKDQE